MSPSLLQEFCLAYRLCARHGNLFLRKMNPPCVQISLVVLARHNQKFLLGHADFAILYVAGLDY